MRMITTKKSSAQQSAKKSGPCWPGYEPVPGKKPGTKESCKPKANQTSAQRKADSKAAAASKLKKKS